MRDDRVARSPISRVGGKFYLANAIIEQFPEHKRYIEVFGGAMHTLFRKPPSELEIFNDIDSSLVTFFEVVKTKPDELIKMLDFSLYSREVFLNAKNNLCIGSDVEQAYNFFIVNRQCFNGKNKSWGVCNKANKTFYMYEQRIREAHERIKKVFIEHMDFRELIKKYDSPDALFLCDPPYMFNESRSKHKFYENEMTEQDHTELVELLKTIKGKFLLCGYTNGLYDYFDRISIGESNMCVNVKVGGEERIKKLEYLWKNF